MKEDGEEEDDVEEGVEEEEGEEGEEGEEEDGGEEEDLAAKACKASDRFKRIYLVSKTVNFNHITRFQ